MKPRQVRNIAALLATIAILSSGFNNCGQRTKMNTRDATLLASAALRGGGSTGGNPAITALRFGSYGAFSTTPPQPSLPTGDGSSPPPVFNQALLSFFSVCASSIQFYPADGSTPFEKELDRDILVLANGTPISDFALPPGSYKAITIKIADTCGTGRSFEVTNVTGTIITTDPTEMAFTGTFSSEKDDIVLTLDISQITQALSQASSADQAVDSINNPTSVLTVGEGDGGGSGSSGSAETQGPTVVPSSTPTGGVILPTGGIIVQGR